MPVGSVGLGRGDPRGGFGPGAGGGFSGGGGAGSRSGGGGGWAGSAANAREARARAGVYGTGEARVLGVKGPEHGGLVASPRALEKFGIKQDLLNRDNTLGEDFGNIIAAIFGGREYGPSDDVLAKGLLTGQGWGGFPQDASWGWDPAGLLGTGASALTGGILPGGLIADQISDWAGRPLMMNVKGPKWGSDIQTASLLGPLADRARRAVGEVGNWGGGLLSGRGQRDPMGGGQRSGGPGRDRLMGLLAQQRRALPPSTGGPRAVDPPFTPSPGPTPPNPSNFNFNPLVVQGYNQNPWTVWAGQQGGLL